MSAIDEDLAANFLAADDPEIDPPYSREQVALSEWPEEQKQAWSVFQTAARGDEVLWGDRKQPLEVVSTMVDDMERATLEVEGPRGGRYTLKESYDNEGNPQFYADDSSALDLRFAAENKGTMESELSEELYEQTVQNLVRSSVNAYVENDYETYDAAVNDVVGSWISSVEFREWRGWPFEWEDDTPTVIYRGILEHSGELPEVDEPGPDAGTTANPKQQAKVTLQNEVLSRGRSLAAEQLISSEADYSAVVEELAEDAIDRHDLKAHLDPREAAREVSENFIDSHPDEAHRAIIQYGFSEPMEPEMYSDLDNQDITKEMAYDVLDQDVWSEARSYHQARGTHDPTLRGLAFFEYDQLAEALVEEALRENAISDVHLYTAAHQSVKQFANELDNYEWPYEFGGLDDRALDEGDIDDTYQSIVMHSEYEPTIFNPFVDDRSRKAAAQVLTKAVYERASNSRDKSEMVESDAVPADEYLQDELGVDFSFDDVRDDLDKEPGDWVRETVKGLDAEDWKSLAGWTFVDELVEEMDATIPFLTDDWTLIDYGIIRTDDKRRRLAWFNRDNGMVLVLDGEVTNPPTEGAYEFEDFSVYTMDWGRDEPRYHMTEASVSEAFSFCQSFVGHGQADVLFVEDANGNHHIKEAITEDDVNTSSFVPNFASDFSMPGPNFQTPDLVAGTSRALQNFGGWVRRNSEVVDTASKIAVMLAIGQWSRVMYAAGLQGLNVEPDYSKQYGPGIKGGVNLGKDPDEAGLSGRIEGNVRITPETFKLMRQRVTPEWLYQAGPTVSDLERQLRRFIDVEAFNKARAVFLGAHLTEVSRGRPQSTAGDKFSALDEDVPGQAVRHPLLDAPERWFYELEVGDTLTRTELASRLERIAKFGVKFSDRRDDIEGSPIFADKRNNLSDAEVYREKLSEPQFYEVGWSLTRDDIIGPKETRLIGTEEEVRETLEGKNDGPVITYRMFPEMFRNFQGTPSTSMLDNVWQYYRERQIDRAKAREGDFDRPNWMENEGIEFEDLSQDEKEAIATYDPEFEEWVIDDREPVEDAGFTLLDVWNRFQMGVVYDIVQQGRDRALSDVMEAAANGERFETTYPYDLDDRTIGEYGLENLRGQNASLRNTLQDPDDRIYIWSIPHNNLQAQHVFRNITGARIPDVLRFSGHPEEEPSMVPPDDIEYLYYDDTGDGEVLRRHVVGGPDEVVDKRSDSNKQTRVLKSGEDLYHDLNPSPRRLVDAIVDADEAIDVDPDESSTKYVSKRGVDWEDLSGTEMSIFGTLLRGINLDTAAAAADFWNLNDRFETRLNDAIRQGAENLKPSRPEFPEFDEWVNKRFGAGTYSNLPSRAQQKARYLREMANEIPGVQSGEAMGTDPTVEEEVELMRDVREHHEDTDYTDYENFYANEFGNSFDDVERKFQAQRPAEGEASDPARTTPPSAYTDEQADTADDVDDPGDEPGYVDDYGENDSSS